jgi:hypothetical protein
MKRAIRGLSGSFFRGTRIYTVRRTSAGAYVDGVWEPGPIKTIEMRMSMQPLNGEEMLRIPEGQRNKEMRKVYSERRLFAQGELSLGRADIIKEGDNYWEVQRVEDWHRFFRAEVVKIEADKVEEYEC